MVSRSACALRSGGWQRWRGGRLVIAAAAVVFAALALAGTLPAAYAIAGFAIVGAAAMLACGVLSLHDAAKAVDYETIVLLFSMMVVV